MGHEKVNPENLPVTIGHGEAPLILEGREGSFRMVKQQLPIPPELLYYIGGKKGGLLASAYDMISREGGICYFDTEIIADSEWDVKVKVKDRFFNAAGRKVEDSEIYQIDVKALYAHARANYEKVDWYRTKAENEYETEEKRKNYKGEKVTVVVTRPIGRVKEYDAESGLPVIHYQLPKAAELDLYQNMLHLKKTKLAKAITCAHRRLAQRAIGVKQISAAADNWDKGVAIPIYSFLPEAQSGGIQEVNDLYGPEMDDGIEGAAPPHDSGPARPQMGPPPTAKQPSPTQQPPPAQATVADPEPDPTTDAAPSDAAFSVQAIGKEAYDIRGVLGDNGFNWRPRYDGAVKDDGKKYQALTLLGLDKDNAVQWSDWLTKQDGRIKTVIIDPAGGVLEVPF